jgi:hypothetical protein
MNAYEIKETEVDENGQNKNLRFHIIDSHLMESVGFRHIYNFWILCDSVDEDITINIKITDNEVGTIDILDDNFCQPYDFQKMIYDLGDNAPFTAIKVQHKLYTILDSMKTFGILEGWEWGDYV